MLTTPATADAATASAIKTAGVVTVRDMSDCRDGWLCVWEWTNYQGDRYSRKSAGTMELEDSWRDRITSVWNRRNSSVVLVNVRTGFPDVTKTVHAGDAIADLGKEGYFLGGNWNNKVDKIILK